MLPAGTLLRFLDDRHEGDPCCDIALDWFEFRAMDGPWAGATVVIEDAPTPRDERAAQLSSTRQPYSSPLT